jgi:hypothetical protein
MLEELKINYGGCASKDRNCWFRMIRSSESSPSTKSVNTYSDLVVLWGLPKIRLLIRGNI